MNGFVALREDQVIYDLLQSELPVSLIRKAFKRLYYPIEIIAQCVRWYLAYALSLRNLEEMMAEGSVALRGIG